MSQLRIPAVYTRGGTSKGVFFRSDDLPADPGERDRILLRTIGSPDPYGKQIDGMGAATSSNIGKRIVAHVPVRGGEWVEEGEQGSRPCRVDTVPASGIYAPSCEPSPRSHRVGYSRYFGKHSRPSDRLSARDARLPCLMRLSARMRSPRIGV